MRVRKRNITTLGISLAMGLTLTGFAHVNAMPDATVSGGATIYHYRQIPPDRAYIYYTVASFTTAAGLIAYTLSYLPSRKAVRRSQYVSRYYDYAKTTY